MAQPGKPQSVTLRHKSTLNMGGRPGMEYVSIVNIEQKHSPWRYKVRPAHTVAVSATTAAASCCSYYTHKEEDDEETLTQVVCAPQKAAAASNVLLDAGCIVRSFIYTT